MSQKEILDRLNLHLGNELTAITQYMWHHVMVVGPESPEISDRFKSAAMDEMKHAEDLAERIDYLGGVPTTKPEAIKVGGDFKKMIRDDLALETRAVEELKKTIKMCGDDPTTRRMLESILADEEDHANTWKTLLGE